METKILEHKKDKLKIEVVGADHTVLGMLREELTNDKDVDFSTYARPHPLLEAFTVTIRGKNPEKSLNSALATVKKDSKEFSAAFKKAK